MGAEAHLEPVSGSLPADPIDARHEIDGDFVSLDNSVAELLAAPGSATTVDGKLWVFAHVPSMCHGENGIYGKRPCPSSYEPETLERTTNKSKATSDFGAPVFARLAEDGNDAALWLVQQPGGSGAFHCVATAINENGGFRGTKAVFLGDRIAPREISIEHRVSTSPFSICIHRKRCGHSDCTSSMYWPGTENVPHAKITMTASGSLLPLTLR
ncbi:MAG: hypothetical protein IH905_09230 [Proteobacteria bacterium]|nr:hypothetical protein [Pseudomonadota bacterium]